MPSIVIHVDACRRVCDELQVFRKPRQRGLALIGSILPDLHNMGVIPEIHGRCEDFLQYMIKTDPKYIPLAFGMVTHDLLDAATWPEKKDELSAARLLKKYHAGALKYKSAAHVMVEHFADLTAVDEDPAILEEIDAVRASLSPVHISKIAFHLTEFFGGDYHTVLAALKVYRTFDISRLGTVEGAADLWNKQIFAFIHRDSLSIPRLPWHRRWLMRLRIGVEYWKFMYSHNQEHLKELALRGRKEFKQHALRCKSASKRIQKHAASLLTVLK